MTLPKNLHQPRILSILLLLILVVLVAPSLAARRRLALASRRQASRQGNDVVFVDLHLNENLERHQTSYYRQNNYASYYVPHGASMVLRRGQHLNLTLHLRQPYDEPQDKIRLEFGTGSEPQLDKGTLIYVPVLTTATTGGDPTKWAATIKRVNVNQLNVEVTLPANMPIGVWSLRISTKMAGSKLLDTYPVSRSLYVIFNSWSEDDDVYLPREDARREYVLNEVGKIYIGSYNRPTGRKWTYGQFHEAVLPATMMLLDKTRITIQERSEAVKVARAVSAMVNSHDDNGLLVGNWSGKYGDGLAPWQWTGSAVIFERYLQQGGHPVKFGQCWVFGGVTTTSLRTLGIPARTITNFVSAHDTDLSLTVDKFYGSRGEQLGGINGDSIWNFHVWSDAWMARYDLPAGFGGWQAIDATPQETSMGKYQLGPASLEAIKQGRVGFAYDVAFVFSEVNADLINWRLDYTSSRWQRTSIQTDHVGSKIYTKMIGRFDDRSAYGVADAENIVDQYKFPEGSQEERAAYNVAVRTAGLTSIYAR